MKVPDNSVMLLTAIHFGIGLGLNMLLKYLGLISAFECLIIYLCIVLTLANQRTVDVYKQVLATFMVLSEKYGKNQELVKNLEDKGVVDGK